MNLDDAIRTAIQYEIRVRDVYLDAAEQVVDESGKKVVKQLAAEEQDHVTYLVERLKEWKDTGVVGDQAIPRRVPGPEQIASTVRVLKDQITGKLRMSSIRNPICRC